MRKGLGRYWRAIGRLGQVFVSLFVIWVFLYIFRSPFFPVFFAGLAVFFLGLINSFRLARFLMRKAIWRLRNRLIAAYLFIAVVPIVLIVTLAGFATKGIIGQMAVYLVNTELTHRESTLLRLAEGATIPSRDADAALSRFLRFARVQFPDVQLVVTGEQQLRWPPNSELSIPAVWSKAGEEPRSGLIIKEDGGPAVLYMWAYVDRNGSTALAIAPITHELLASLVAGLGDVNYTPIMGHIAKSHLPPRVNPFDFQLSGYIPVTLPVWDTLDDSPLLYLVVNTRLSAVLGTIFGQQDVNFMGQKLVWSEVAVVAFAAITLLFLVVEVFSLLAGIQLSRSITGAVHEIYEGTQRVKEGDFSYRIPVKGSDQLAELGSSFNTMTENLGRLIVVAKEKERLESELAIAREVQNQLFPKDVPSTRTLELRGVCHPARMVSGDYYDFMPLAEGSVAFAIGDVAGKGISAALLMATIQSTMRTQLSTSNGAGPSRSTANMVATLNRQLYANTAPEKYATFYFAMYNEAKHLLTYTNAGHLSPILLRDGGMCMLEPTGTVVGAFPFAAYEEKSVELHHGDTLVAYTDGIVEPENAYGEMFGDDRFQDLLQKYAHADTSEIISRSMEAVVQWTGSSELQDDMTMVVARRI